VKNIEILGIYAGFIQLDKEYLQDLKRWKAQEKSKDRIMTFKKKVCR
jgi:hypothetical protein